MDSLHRAVYESDVYEVQKVLRSHDDVNRADKNGNTALHIASLKRNVNIIDSLLRNGADINIQNNNGRTPLMATMFSSDCMSKAKNKTKKEVAAAMELLLSKGANPNLVDNQGDTILHQAIRKFVHRSIKKDCISLLIQRGADVQIMNKRGKTPYDETVEWRVAKLILMFNFYVAPGILLSSKEINKAKEEKEKNNNNKTDDDIFTTDDIIKTNDDIFTTDDVIKTDDDVFSDDVKKEEHIMTSQEIRKQIELEVHLELQKVLAKHGA